MVEYTGIQIRDIYLCAVYMQSEMLSCHLRGGESLKRPEFELYFRQFLKRRYAEKLPEFLEILPKVFLCELQDSEGENSRRIQVLEKMLST